MQYRFFITYGITPIREGQVSTATTVEIFPSGAMGLKFERPDENCADFRRLWNGQLTLKDKDYKLLKSLEVKNKYAPVMLIVKKRKVNIWSEFWRGQFSPYNCQWDNDQCTCSFNPTVLDKYSALLDNFEIEKNVIECQLAEPFKASIINNTETVTYTQNVGVDLADVNQEVITWNWAAGSHTISFNGKYFEPKILEPFGNNNYRNVFVTKPNVPQAYTQNDGWLLNKMSYDTAPNGYGVKMELIRTVSTTIDVNGVPTPPVGGTWYNVGVTTLAGFNAHKWARLGSETSTLYYNRFETSYVGGIYVFERKIKALGTYSRGRWVYDILQFYLDSFVLELNSKFFTDSVNPVTLESPNQTKLMQLIEKSDVKSPTSSEPATREYYKFSDLIGDLCDTFNLRWKIENNTFVIEHVLHFTDNQLLDLTQLEAGRWVKHLNKYGYISDEIPNKETWSWSDNTDDVDFSGVPITYQSINTTGKVKDNTSNKQIGGYASDLSGIITNAASYSNNGFMIVGVVFNGTEYVVNDTTGIITGLKKLNGYLSMSNLNDKFWKYERPLPVGTMNGIPNTIFTARKQKRQQQIAFPLDENEYTPYSNIKTGLGWGRVTDLELDMKTNTYKTTLEYD